MTRGTFPRIALLALIWGSAFLWIKLADRGFSPVEVTLARLASGAAVLFAVMLARREKVPRSLSLWASIVIAALFANAVPYLLFAVAEQTVNSSTAGVINATTPLWTVILALAVRHQKNVTRWQAAGLIVGFAGAVLIFSPWRATAGLLSPGGLECLAASVSYAISYVYMDRFLARRGIGAIVLSACQLAAAAVMLAIALGVSGVRTPHVTAESIAAIAVLGIVGTGFAYVLNYQIITSDGATVASTVTYLLPVVAIVLGVLVLSESITATMLAGIGMVLAGVALTRRQPKPGSRVSNLVANLVPRSKTRSLVQLFAIHANRPNPYRGLMDLANTIISALGDLLVLISVVILVRTLTAVNVAMMAAGFRQVASSSWTSRQRTESSVKSWRRPA